MKATSMENSVNIDSYPIGRVRVTYTGTCMPYCITSKHDTIVSFYSSLTLTTFNQTPTPPNCYKNIKV